VAVRGVRNGSRTLLVVSGGTEAVAGIMRARELGLHVVVSDASAEAPGFAVADDMILASTYDVAETVAAARRYHEHTRPIDGVMCIASDVPLTVASVAADLGLAGIPVESARMATDKLAMKQRFAEDGINVPWFHLVESRGELERLIGDRGLPAVLKPVDSRGARGVLLLADGVDRDWAYATSRAQSPSGRLLLEQYLQGPQISTESLVIGGCAHTIGLADRNYRQLARFAPFMIEDGGELPSALSAGELDAVCALVQRATESLEVREGVVKGDVVLSEGTAFMIELAPRLSGGYLCTFEIPLSTGVDFVGAAIQIALGEEVSPDQLIGGDPRGVAQRWLFPEPGRVRRIAGVERVAARPEVALCEVRVSVGDEIGPVESHPARAGVVIATGPTRAQAIDSAERAVADIVIETAPVGPA
jgi:biotin carboxylase